MVVRVLLFASARERAGGKSWVEVEVAEASTVGELRHAIVSQWPELAPLFPATRIAVDSEYASDDRVVGPGSEVAIIPPVSGGGEMLAG